MSAINAVAWLVTVLVAGTPVQVQVEDAYPTVGVETTVTIAGEYAALRVVYQPAAPVAKRVTVSESARSVVKWTPTKAGVASVEAVDSAGQVLAKKDVSVKFANTPPAGIAIFVIAGLVLFGGATLSLRSLLRGS